MGCKCGSQIILCNLPVRFDTYRGCSHGCRYCFAQKKNDISHIERDESVDGLRSFIEGKRGNETEWCDWNIPIHWGGMSDPFQPVEKQIRASYECLKLLAETKYPFVVSTKGRLIADPEYLDLLAQCNCVLQISTWCAASTTASNAGRPATRSGSPSSRRYRPECSAPSSASSRICPRCSMTL
ncbi:MAG: hypothetical protein ACLSG5_15275 [Oscillospiraceae bacterium]